MNWTSVCPGLPVPQGLDAAVELGDGCTGHQAKCDLFSVGRPARAGGERVVRPCHGMLFSAPQVLDEEAFAVSVVVGNLCSVRGEARRISHERLSVPQDDLSHLHTGRKFLRCAFPDLFERLQLFSGDPGRLGLIAVLLEDCPIGLGGPLDAEPLVTETEAEEGPGGRSAVLRILGDDLPVELDRPLQVASSLLEEVGPLVELAGGLGARGPDHDG